MIEVKHLTKIFNTGGNEIKAVQNVSLTIADGEFVSIVGRSGSGKSTLMNLIGGLDQSYEGEITVNGHKLSGMNSDQLAAYRAMETGFIFQSFHLEHAYTVFDNIRVALLILGIPFREHKKRVDAALERVGLTDKVNVRAGKLSGGEKQRVAIARALIKDPAIILADEPCGNLNRNNSDRILSLLEQFHHNGKTVILVTHNTDDAQRANRMIELCDGVVVRDEKKSSAMADR